MKRGYTLMETLLALVTVAFISLSAAAVLQAAAYGTAMQRDARRIAVRGETLRTRINSAISNSRAVLAVGSGYIVLWTSDTNPDGHVNLSELELIQVPSGSTTMTAYVGEYADGDPVYATTSNFYTIAQAAKTSGHFPAATWATGASGFTFTLDNSTPMLAKMATWSLTLADQKLSPPVIGAAKLAVWSQPR